MDKRTSHPFVVVQRICESYKERLKLEFSGYVYTPQTIADVRTYFYAEQQDLDLDQILGNANEGEEIAISSRVRRHGMTFHIPMMDLANHAMEYPIVELKSIIKNVLSEDFPHVADHLFFFKTGRSYHVYSTVLIEKAEWDILMGILLLMQLPDGSSVIDPRWVGHSLCRGHNALRWSCNSGTYLQMPDLCIC